MTTMVDLGDLQTTKPWWNRPLWGSPRYEDRPWWNRPLWGKVNAFQTIIAALNKPAVDPQVITQYNQELARLKELTHNATLIYIEEFGKEEFLSFLSKKQRMAENVGEYQGLSHSIQLLLAGLEKRKKFQTLEQLELRYQGLKQQDLDRFVVSLLEKKLTQEKLVIQINNRIEKLLVQVKSKHSKVGLQNYRKLINLLAENELALELLSRFKQCQVTNYDLLNKILDVVEQLELKQSSDKAEFLDLIKNNQQLFQETGSIIGLGEEKNTPETQATILEYIFLAQKYQTLYSHFRQFMVVLRVWENNYRELVSIQQQYNSKQYQQPQDFLAEIPGLDFYHNYNGFLDLN